MAEIPNEFTKVIKDFVRDLKITFPEYIPLVKKWWKEPEEFQYIEEIEERTKVFKKTEKKCIQILFTYCQKKLPPRFFDILYENTDMFQEDSVIDTEFLPNIHFRNLWNSDITDKTRETLWKYLQLILFSIISTLDNTEAFGDSAKLFEVINQEDFNKKLQETVMQMEGLFDASLNRTTDPSTMPMPNFDPSSLPNPDDIQSHIAGMLEGKLGQLAREIAEETTADLGVSADEVTDMKDVFNKLIKNPAKLMDLVKSVSTKLDTKIKSGELKESELIAEATELMSKMKSMPGMGNIQSLLSKMGLGGKGKVNTGAMEAQLTKNLKYAKTKERIKAKAQAVAEAKLLQEMKIKAQQEVNKQVKPISDDELVKFMSGLSSAEKTPRKKNNEVQQGNKALKKSKK